MEDEFMSETTEKYQVSQKKTIEEYAKLDAEDASLAKWKASIGLSADTKPYPVKADDKRSVVIVEMALVYPENPELQDIVIPLEDASGNTLAKSEIKFEVKEKAVYDIRVRFRVQHELITGLRYLHLVKKAGIPVDKMDEPLGSYVPNTVEKPFYEKYLGKTEAPSGVFARGQYAATTRFIDDDKTCHLQFSWTFKIVK